jgi:hypothetical protein
VSLGRAVTLSLLYGAVAVAVALVLVVRRDVTS